MVKLLRFIYGQLSLVPPQGGPLFSFVQLVLCPHPGQTDYNIILEFYPT